MLWNHASVFTSIMSPCYLFLIVLLFFSAFHEADNTSLTCNDANPCSSETRNFNTESVQIVCASEGTHHIHTIPSNVDWCHIHTVCPYQYVRKLQLEYLQRLNFRRRLYHPQQHLFRCVLSLLLREFTLYLICIRYPIEYLNIFSTSDLWRCSIL